jgi:hypothetical protein
MGKMSTVGVLRLRATSAVTRDKSATRSAQDDEFVGGGDHPITQTLKPSSVFARCGTAETEFKLQQFVTA